MNRFASLENNLTRAAIFVDIADMYYAAYSACQSKIDYSKLLSILGQGHDVVVANAYLLFDKEVEFNKFETALIMAGYDIKKKTKEIFSNRDGTIDKTKTTKLRASWEVGMTVDMIKWAPKVDTIILVSGNVRFVDVLKHISSMTRVVIAAFDRFASTKIMKENCDEFIDLIPNKELGFNILLSDNAIDDESIGNVIEEKED